jgi:hypothetical protein
VEIAGDELYFQVISSKNETVDFGTIRRPPRNRQPVDTASLKEQTK